MFSGDITVILFALLAAISVGAVAAAIFFPKVSGSEKSDKRLATVATRQTRRGGAKEAVEEQHRNRRKQVHETLKELDAKQKAKKKRPSLRAQIAQAGLAMSVRMFWVVSVLAGLVVGLIVLITGSSLAISVMAMVVAAIGLPRWVLRIFKKRRMQKFIDALPDAVDVVVRGIKAGLPVNDSFKVVAAESPDPVGPEFSRLIEGQRLGVSLAEGLERMYDRIPLAEVNFLSIVINIQMKTGGNLAEALSNLAHVLRDRKKMKGKIRAMSQEAKSSAAIIGALPIMVMALMYVVNPDYISLLWTERMGQILLVGCAIWMMMGVLVMRKMINFDF